jgi:8-oxo-dGTP pyrophosphatase MutT (NUDIX family)
MATERSAGAVIYRLTGMGEVRYLLLQAAHGKPWGFPKGKLDPGETDLVAARREIREEAGLKQVDVDPHFRTDVRYRFRRGHTLVRKDVVYFLARAHTSHVQISHEHVAFRWADLDAALDLVVFDNTREVLLAAAERLKEILGEAPTGPAGG